MPVNGIWLKIFMVFCMLSLPVVAMAFSFEFVQQSNFGADTAGFFSGLWHGLIAPYSLIARWFSEDIGMYAASNTGWFYDAGFLLGVGCSLPIGWLAAIIAVIATFI
jgi:hypothetical protein